MRNRLQLLALLTLALTATVVGCGGDEAYKLEAKPDVDYQALENEATDEEDVSKADVRSLEK